jgi:small subunit ribosomal protein S8
VNSTDPIADMLTSVRNASRAHHPSVDVPMSKIKLNIAKVLKEQGFISDYEPVKDAKFPTLRMHLRYTGRREPVISGIKRISKPGQRIYRGATELPRVRGGLGVAVVSTSQGIMTERQARRNNMGGEVLCFVW